MADNLMSVVVNDLKHTKTIDNLQVIDLGEKYITCLWTKVVTYQRDGDNIHHMTVVSKIKESIDLLRMR